ncbi:MAG TPA: rhodanese-like domain-containing protein [Gemmatimonadales bacterium]|nr:rhodanese-like domain-containing protein [Gemmatimonadales bacterium]
MIFLRLYDEPLAQASYLIGCADSGTAVVIDPNRLVEQYVSAATARGLTITAVTETHIHADFVSGSRELARRTGATVYLSECGPPEWQYEFRHEGNVRLLADGAVIRVGQVELAAVHTPGHTPEHLSFLVTDRATANEPMGILTGDFVFVGDVGRPDLLEKTARVVGSAESGAHQLFTSLGWFKTLPDHLQIWPGHGAGSACGKGLSAVPQSTVGFERRYNWALGVDDEAEFVRQVLDGQPEPPRYFGQMKRINRAGPPIRNGVTLPPRVPENRLREVLGSPASVADTRSAAEFAAGHLPGSLSLPFNKSFPTWAGSLLPYDGDIYLLVDTTHAGELERLIESLTMIGLDTVRGYFDLDALAAWRAAGQGLEQTGQVSVADVAAGAPALMVVDVRGRSEWDHGHIPGALHIPLAELAERLDEIPEDQPIAVHCQGGGRSAIAASVLQAAGRTRVSNVTGGFGAWSAAGLPVRNGDEA